MSDPGRRRAEAIVRRFLDGAIRDEAEHDRLLAELKQLAPDPHVSDLIFWPQHHAASRDIDLSDLTAERIVELAFDYEPFAL